MQVAKWGSSLAVRLPVALHAELLPVSGTRLSSLDQGRRKPEGRRLSATYHAVLSLEKTRDARFSLLMRPPFTQSDVWMLPIQVFSIRSAISHDLIHLLSGFVGAGLKFAGISGFCGLARLLVRMPWNRKAMTASTVGLHCPNIKESS